MMIIGVVVTEDAMGELLVPDELWALVEPIPPKHPYVPGVSDRVCLTGILFVLKNGLPWEAFPQEMGCCGMTLWNRLDEWRKAGVWDALHRLLLDKLRGEDAIDFDRVVVDSSSVRAVHGGKKPAPAPWTAANAAASTTWPSTPTASRWPASSRPPIAPTSRN